MLPGEATLRGSCAHRQATYAGQHTVVSVTLHVATIMRQSVTVLQIVTSRFSVYFSSQTVFGSDVSYCCS
jgi:hypothetical protein